ncbi:hypothetical protein BCR34DRAFT_576704 [Clohesyomyces aquaticus]|uniref:Core domain-containing protein n=1 Tax=Clohesyomyces aquaticus TaxID=1231657 RepID=A0A1Y1YMH1_9PLEO|nr:hypothetical protein BCR34DRAFT_576704 [Clohesyomyces aquaticus]
MAPTTNTCTAYIRTTRTTPFRRCLSSPRPLRLPPSRAFRVAPATQRQLLYLDFLAPSAFMRPARLAAGSSPRQMQHRSLTTSPSSTTEPAPDAPPPPQTHLARPILNSRITDDGTPMAISLTPRAASRLSGIATADQNPNSALRITVESGGCHGFQYLMNLVDLGTTPPLEEDTVFEGEKGAKVVIDESSLELLNGSTIDYTMELIGSQFKVTGIPGAVSSCGCGTSFDIKI